MPLIKADRVKETSTSTGATTFALAGAVTGFQAFSSVCLIGDTFYYVIDSNAGSEWETGLGTYSAANTLTRTTVYASSNSGSIVTFSAGTKNVYISLTGRQIDTVSAAPPASTSAPPLLESLAGAAHTALTASTEYNDIYWNLARTVQFSAGTIATQRAVRISQPTYSFVSASTITDAATVQIDGAPVAGTNATITNSVALKVLTGPTTSKGIILQASSAAHNANLFEWQDSAGVVLGRIHRWGALYSHGYGGESTGNTVLGTSPGFVFGVATNNTYVGNGAGSSNSLGASNTGMGSGALSSITSGSRNTAIGVALGNITTGGDNIAIGNSAGGGLTTGSYNTHVGSTAGRYLSNGSTSNTTASQCVYVGFNSKALGAGESNSTVIGNQAVSAGSNTAVIGDTNVVATYLTSPTLYISNLNNAAKISLAPRTTGGGASGGSLTIFPQDGYTSGDGGSVILQAGSPAGAFAYGTVAVKSVTSQTSNLQEWQNSSGTVLSAILPNGAIQPATLVDSAAANNSIYYSSTAGKLVYKNSAGTVNNLY